MSMLNKQIVCAETGKSFIGAIDGITTNYAYDNHGNYFSDEGVDIRQKRELLDRNKPFFAYVSSDGKSITGWKGNTLMNVISSTPCRLSRMSYTHSNKTYRSIVARDIHGGLWYGRGSAGVCITMRPYK